MAHSGYKGRACPDGADYGRNAVKYCVIPSRIYVCLICLASMWNTAASKYNASLDALEGRHRAKDLEISFQLNREAAEEGYSEAVLAMGWYYLNGFGTAKDISRSIEWYKRAARSGETRALFSLGEIAYRQRDYATAKLWFQRALKRGHIGSHYWLGKMYWKGLGVSKDIKAGRRLIDQAAQKNYTVASRVVRFLGRRRANPALQRTSGKSRRFGGAPRR